MEKLVAYFGDKKVKAKYLSRIREHRRLDHLTQGIGWEANGTTKGCAIGCCFNKYDHSLGPVEIGVPTVLMYLEDSIFEGLPRADALKWPMQFLQAIEPGADLSLVWPRFAVWLLTDEKRGVIRFAGERGDVRDSIERVAGLWQRVIDGQLVESAEFRANAANAANAAYDARAAYDAAYAAVYAAYAAYAAYDAAYAARKVHWRACAAKCIELIKECSIG